VVTHTTTFKINYQGKETCHKFLIADIGEDDIILGYPFFEGTNPDINWANGTMEGTVELKGTTEDSLWIKTLLGKTTVAQQLAEAATEKKKKSWDELVPEQYHCYNTTGSFDDKSLGGAWAILGDDTKSFGRSVVLVRSVRQL